MNRRERGRRSAFTLIVILVVIGIISILASAILTGVAIAKQKAMVSIAKSMVSSLDAAVEHYAQDTGVYPGRNARDPGNGFPELFDALLDERPPAGQGGPGAPFLRVPRGEVLVLDGDGSFRPEARAEVLDRALRRSVRDPWGRPYVYRENRSRPAARGMSNPRSFDIYSLGRDGIDQTILGEEGDDIGNW